MIAVAWRLSRLVCKRMVHKRDGSEARCVVGDHIRKSTRSQAVYDNQCTVIQTSEYVV
jgi:hypothetical protein